MRILQTGKERFPVIRTSRADAVNTAAG